MRASSRPGLRRIWLDSDSGSATQLDHCLGAGSDTHRFDLDTCVTELLEQLVVCNEFDSLRTRQHGRQDSASETDPFMTRLHALAQRSLPCRDYISHPGFLNTREAIVVGMEEGEQSANELGRSDRFIESLRVE